MSEAGERVERRCSLLDGVELGEAGLEDWRRLAGLHYRSHRLGGVDRLWALRYEGDLLAVAAYCYPSANLAGRNRALAELVRRLPQSGRVRFWNEHMRTISRVVVDPNWRGLGLAARLVRETLPRAGTAYVEAVAAMGRVHPFFERAGMTRYATAPSAGSERLREALATAGVDRRACRSAESLVAAVRAIGDAAMREWAEGELERWARGYLGAKKGRTTRPTLEQASGYASRFLWSEGEYYLWAREGGEECAG